MSKIIYDYQGKSSMIQPVVIGIPDDYIAYYKFDGDATDETGTYNGTVVGATLTTDRFSDSNKAYSFSGTQKITLGNLNMNFNTISISMWVTISSIPVIADLLNNDWFNSTGTFLCHINSSFYPVFILRDTSDASHSVTSTNAVSTNTWYNIVFVYDGSNVKVYVDGSEDCSASATFTPKQTNVAWGFNDAGHDLNGKLDDIMVYDRALTSTEVSTIYNTQKV